LAAPWTQLFAGGEAQLSGSAFGRSFTKVLRRMHHLWSPVAGLVPATHVFAVRSVERKEGVDAHGSSPWAEGPRAKPGQGDRGLCWELEKQPISLNPTAVVGERESHSHFYKPFSPRASS